MIRPVASVLAAASLLLTACGEEPTPEPAPAPVATPTPSGPRSLVAADFAGLELGAKIDGPVGPEVNVSFVVDNRSIGDIVSYVACPVDMDPCDPETAPEGTVYTYVHQVTPGKDTDNDAPMGYFAGPDEVTSASRFATARRAPGFNGSLGYDRAQAERSLGSADAISVADDNGTLVWRIVGGDGWTTGETLTFFWRSTLPPDRPAEVYHLFADNKTANAKGPFPAPPPETDGASGTKAR